MESAFIVAIILLVFVILAVMANYGRPPEKTKIVIKVEGIDRATEALRALAVGFGHVTETTNEVTRAIEQFAQAWIDGGYEDERE